MQAGLAALVVQRLLDAADGPSGGSATTHPYWRLAWWLACQAACLLATGSDSRCGFAAGAAELTAAANRAGAVFIARVDATPAGQAPSGIGEAAAAARLGCAAHAALLERAAQHDRSHTLRDALAELEASRPLVPATQLVRQLLCAVAAAQSSHRSVPALLVPSTGTGGASAADELLATVGLLQQQLDVLSRRVMMVGIAASGGVPPTAAQGMQQSEADGVAALAAVVECCLRCLSDLPSIRHGARGVLHHASGNVAAAEAAATLPEAIAQVASSGIASMVLIIQAYFTPEDAPGQSMRPWASCFDACASLAATACKFGQLTAAQPQLRAALEAAGYSHEPLAGLKMGVLSAATPIDMLGDRLSGPQRRCGGRRRDVAPAWGLLCIVGAMYHIRGSLSR